MSLERYSQLVDAAVVELDLCAYQHLTSLFGIEPQLNTGPIWRREAEKKMNMDSTHPHPFYIIILCSVVFSVCMNSALFCDDGLLYQCNKISAIEALHCIALYYIQSV